MEEQTNPVGGVEQASPEERMLRFFQQKEQPEPVQEQAETQEAAPPQPEDQAQTEELTPEDIPEEAPQVAQSAADEFEIVHNGQQKKLSREETIRLAQQGFDYTQKTQELAKQREAVTTNFHKSQEALQMAMALAPDLATVKAIESQLSQYQKVDWVQLASNDPLEYPKYRAQFDQLNAAYQQAVGTLQNKAGQLQQRQAEIKRQLIQQELPKLLERIPEWRDQAKMAQGARDLTEYLTSEGVSQDAIANIDAVSASIARKAMLYDRLSKAKAEKVKQLRTAPPVTRPNAPQSSSQAKADRDRDALGKFKKSGDMRDAAQVLLNRWKG